MKRYQLFAAAALLLSLAAHSEAQNQHPNQARGFNANGVYSSGDIDHVNLFNGNLTVNYITAPKGPSEYYTLNGKLQVTYPATLSAVCQFKSWNGAFYTEFENAEVLPVIVTKNEERRDAKTIYKLNIAKRVQIGSSGGPLYKFETMNGNIYVKKQS